jgi:hypothetical protein
MLELREKEIENKTKKINLQKIEVLRNISIQKEKTGNFETREKGARRLKVVLDRGIESDAYIPLKHRKDEIVTEKMSVLSVSSGEPEHF